MLGFFIWCVATFISTLYAYRKLWAHMYFKRLGIPGPPPHWLFGNLMELSGEGDIHLKIAEWSKQYGKVFGYFEGPSPVLVISDVADVSSVFVKQFASFHGRKMFHYQPDPDDPKDAVSVFFARGDRWKRLRTIINPAFTSKKMRQMTSQMSQYQDYFMELVAKRSKNGQAFNIFDCFQLLTIDTIGECAFGIALNSIKSEGRDNIALQRIKEMLEMTFKIPKVTILTMVLPELKPLLTIWVKSTSSFSNSILAPMYWLYGVIDKLIAERKKNNIDNQPSDLLQMILDAEIDGGWTSNNHYSKALSHEEIKAQVFIFLLAGYETTSNVLAFASYLLAMNDDKQRRLIDEIDKHLCNGASVDYDSVGSLTYLDAVVNETLRLFPVGLLLTNRLSMEETQFSGYSIPKDLPVQPDVWSIHHDQTLWGPVDPWLFHPERWLSDYPTFNRPEGAFLSFGFGPRTCVGMRFALLEMKLTLVNLLRCYKIEPCEKTEPQLQLKVAHTMAPKNGIWVRLSRRELLKC